MKKFGLVGKKLSYSFSQLIHTFLLEKYEIEGTYDLIEVDELSRELLEAYDGLNITIPYKEDVRPFLQEVHTEISAINTVKNTAVNLAGYNTDIFGFIALIERLGFETQNISLAILGNGATSHMIQTYFGDQVVAVVSRDGDTAYDFTMLDTVHADILVNTTPVGMAEYATPIPQGNLKQFKGVVDLNYNPLNSKLALECLAEDVPFIGGLYMLIIQAIKAFEIWNDVIVDEQTIEEIYQLIIRKTTTKLALIGMPLSGKTTFVEKHHGLDVDQEIEKRMNQKIPDLIEKGIFRDVETQTIRELVDEGQKLIALGGGAVLKVENIALLHEYTIIFLNTPIEELKKRWEPGARPLLKTLDDIDVTYRKRYPLYLERSNLQLVLEDLESWVEE